MVNFKCLNDAQEGSNVGIRVKIVVTTTSIRRRRFDPVDRFETFKKLLLPLNCTNTEFLITCNIHARKRNY